MVLKDITGLASSPNFGTAAHGVDAGVNIRVVDVCIDTALNLLRVSVHQVLYITRRE
jgi:hypothetical protein